MMLADAERGAEPGRPLPGSRLSTRPRARWPGWMLCLALGLLTMVQGARAQSQCVNDDPEPAVAAGSARDPAAARTAWQDLIRAALERSRAVGAARLLADAARQDLLETRAGADWQANLDAAVGPSLRRSGGATASSLLQGSAAISLSRTLYDGGRHDRLVDWRERLADAARLGQATQQEQVVLTTVSLAVDLGRYREHEQVYGLYVRKMACLVDALQTIVHADRGRASELLQVQKALQQAELARAQAQSTRRQTEIRLQRLLGEGVAVPRWPGRLVDRLPAVEQVLADARNAAELQALAAQADAAASYAQALDAGQRPHLSWTVSGSRGEALGGNVGAGHSLALSTGVQLSVPLLSPGTDNASDAARLRERAAREQYGDALESRLARVRETWEQADSSLDRAQRIRTVLGESEKVREATLLQWQQLGRRSLFDVMAAEAEHYSLRVAQVNAELDAQQLGALLWSLGAGLQRWLNVAP
jgi:outer membrane protein, adhesin transport system